MSPGDDEPETPLGIPDLGTPEQHLEMWLELTGVETQVPAERHEELRNSVIASYRRFQQGNELVFPIPVVVASGRA